MLSQTTKSLLPQSRLCEISEAIPWSPIIQRPTRMPGEIAITRWATSVSIWAIGGKEVQSMRQERDDAARSTIYNSLNALRQWWSSARRLVQCQSCCAHLRSDLRPLTPQVLKVDQHTNTLLFEETKKRALIILIAVRKDTCMRQKIDVELSAVAEEFHANVGCRMC